MTSINIHVIDKKHDKVFTSKRITAYIQRMIKDFLAVSKIFRWEEKELKNKFFVEKRSS